MQQAARWLVVILTSLVVLHGNVFAERTVVSENSCAESCDQRCPCCVSESVPQPSAPLAPASPTRVASAKDFQFVPLLAVLLAPGIESGLSFIVGELSISHRGTVPLFERHCVYLI